jgi:hypothetical protein
LLVSARAAVRRSPRALWADPNLALPSPDLAAHARDLAARPGELQVIRIAVAIDVPMSADAASRQDIGGQFPEDYTISFGHLFRVKADRPLA